MHHRQKHQYCIVKLTVTDTHRGKNHYDWANDSKSIMCVHLVNYTSDATRFEKLPFNYNIGS